MRTLILFFYYDLDICWFLFLFFKIQFYVPFEILIEMVFSSFAPPPE